MGASHLNWKLSLPYAMRPLVLLVVIWLVASGCCVTGSTSVRNSTGRDIGISVFWQTQQVSTVSIPAFSTGRCAGVAPVFFGQGPELWVVSDGRSIFTFADVSPIYSLPRQFTSSSRLTREFPCKRFTKHVMITPDMSIHALRVIGYTDSEPSPFPIHYTSKQSSP